MVKLGLPKLRHAGAYFTTCLLGGQKDTVQAAEKEMKNGRNGIFPLRM
jgi:hypothetical protein